ncbi:uncharacterized protein LOC127813430 [Diospyros lotus]|uniref:uncharacterized protein LOC127813430 n=1 Tax=Diospyros lotus TaxID=55363 RepID=UPI002255D380|nr:uncharacterized protein LOC127813430 [Diospyros lotus]
MSTWSYGHPLLIIQFTTIGFIVHDVPAESVMHKCVVHFIPLNKQIPNRKQHPGFIVQKVYDTEQRRLFKLTDKDYEDTKQCELDELVQKTLARLGDLPDIETEDNHTDQEDQLKNKRLLWRKNMSPLDVSRDDEAMTKSGQPLKAETPGSVTSNTSEYYTILSNFKALTGETQRDKWLERLLQGIQFICTPMDSGQSDAKEDLHNSSSKGANGAQEKSGDTTFVWPDSAVPAVTALEKASHAALSTDFQKYNQKMRQLVFNLKNNALLARRLLNGELEPSQIMNLSPTELKVEVDVHKFGGEEGDDEEEKVDRGREGEDKDETNKIDEDEKEEEEENKEEAITEMLTLTLELLKKMDREINQKFTRLDKEMSQMVL